MPLLMFAIESCAAVLFGLATIERGRTLSLLSAAAQLVLAAQLLRLGSAPTVTGAGAVAVLVVGLGLIHGVVMRRERRARAG